MYYKGREVKLESTLALLNEIERFSEWSDRDTIEELKIYLDTIHELTNEAIELLLLAKGVRDNVGAKRKNNENRC